MGASIVAGVGGAPALELSQHILDLVTFAIKQPIMRDWGLAVPLGWYSGGNASLGRRCAEPVGVIAAISNQRFGLREGVDHQRRTLIVVHLAFAEQHNQWPTFAIVNSVKRGIQAAFGASDMSGNIPFLSRLAAFSCQPRQDPIKHANAAPADEAAIDRVRLPIFCRPIAPPRAVPHHETIPPTIVEEAEILRLATARNRVSSAAQRAKETIVNTSTKVGDMHESNQV